MNKKLVKHAVSFMILAMLFAVPMFVVRAQSADDYFEGVGDGELSLPQGEGEGAVAVVTNVINIVLGLLGLIAVIIILIGGFKWMTAQGSDDKVEDAKKTIKYGLIGLVIILFAYIIVRIVIGAIYDVGTGADQIS